MIFTYIILLFFLFLFVRNKYMGLITVLLSSPALTCIILFGNISLYFVLCLIILLFFNKEIIRAFYEKNSFKPILIIYLFAQLISVIKGDVHHYFIPFASFFEEFVMVLALYMAIKYKQCSPIFLKVLYTLTLLIFVLTVVEAITGYNPYTSFCFSHNIFSGGNDYANYRYGLKRCNGIFSYIETLSGYSMMSASISVCLLVSNALRKQETRKIYLVLIMSSIMCFLAGSRSGIIALVVAAMPILTINKKTRYITLGLVAVLAFSMTDYFASIISAITDSSSVDGSNADMRQGQFDVAFSYLTLGRGAFGYGPGYTDEMVIGVDTGIVGAESLWIRIIIDQGILGVLANSLIIIASVFYVRKRNKLCVFLPIAYLIARTLAVVPNMPNAYIMFTVLLVSSLYIDRRQMPNTNFTNNQYAGKS